MHQPAIQFQTYEVAAPPDPARMDVTAFVGFATPRAGVALPAALQDALAQTYGDDGTFLVNRPVHIGSIAMFEALFEPDDRLAAVAQIRGGLLSKRLPGSGVDPTLTVILNGVLHDINLLPLPTTPQDAFQRIRDGLAAARLPVSVKLTTLGSAQSLTFSINPKHGPGTLAVLPYPTLGFAQTQRSEAQLLPTPMVLAVRQFFHTGGETAVVVAMGPAPAYDTPRETRMGALKYLALGGPQLGTTPFGNITAAFARADHVAPLEPAQWHGVQHMIGARDVTFICLPDLPELVAPRPVTLPDLPSPLTPQEMFNECLPAAGSIGNSDAPRYRAPELDDMGAILWTKSIDRVLATITTEMRDKFLLAALPRTQAGTILPAPADSAFLQLAEGWVRSNVGAAAPEGLIAPDALLAGHLARQSRAQGTFLSAANQTVLGIRDVETRASSTLPTCKFESDLRGIKLFADITTSSDPAWADAPVSRLMALLLRECQDFGDAMTFEPSGPALWQTARTVLRGLMDAVYRTGALAGTGEGDSYHVTCDRTTMSDDDISSGRLIAELSFRPSRPVSKITVRLPLATTGRST